MSMTSELSWYKHIQLWSPIRLGHCASQSEATSHCPSICISSLFSLTEQDVQTRERGVRRPSQGPLGPLHNKAVSSPSSILNQPRPMRGKMLLISRTFHGWVGYSARKKKRSLFFSLACTQCPSNCYIKWNLKCKDDVQKFLVRIMPKHQKPIEGSSVSPMPEVHIKIYIRIISAL